VSDAVRRAVIGGTLITIGALAGLFASTGMRERVLDAYLVALGAVLMLMLIRTARTLIGDRGRSPFDQRHGIGRRPLAYGLGLEHRCAEALAGHLVKIGRAHV